MRKNLLMILMIISVSVVTCDAATYYVVTDNVNAAEPYQSWDNAGTNIIDVVNCAMTNAGPWNVLVSNGTYYLTNQVSITNALTIQSVNGREVTIIDGNNYVGKPVTNRCFYLANNSAAVLDGFTLRHGYVIGDAGGVYCAAGAYVKNCRIVNCTATNIGNVSLGGGACVKGVMINCEILWNTNRNDSGGGLYVPGGGVIENCIVASNKLYLNVAEANGAGIMLQGLISNCVIYGNTSPNACSGGGIRISYGTVYNSLVYKNGTATTSGGGIYVYDNATLVNCTVASNIGTTGGIYIQGVGSDVDNYYNVICYHNTGSVSSNINFNTRGFHYIYNSCIAPTNSFPTNGYYANNVGIDPRFMNKDADDWRLQASSPCVNAGTNQNWMTHGVDLAGIRRILYGTVDIGAYERINEGSIYTFY